MIFLFCFSGTKTCKKKAKIISMHPILLKQKTITKNGCYESFFELLGTKPLKRMNNSLYGETE